MKNEIGIGNVVEAFSHTPSDTENWQFLTDEPRMGRLATVSVLGEPHVVPIWYLPKKGSLLIHSERKSRKIQDLQANSKYTLTVDDDSWPYRGVQARGTARILPRADSDPLEVIAQQGHAYLGPELGSRLAQSMEVLIDELVVVELHVESLAGWDYSLLQLE